MESLALKRLLSCISNSSALFELLSVRRITLFHPHPAKKLLFAQS